MNLQSKRQNLKELLEKRDGRIVVAIGVSNGMEAKILYATICEMYEKKEIPAFIGGVITFVSGFLAAANHGLPDLGYILREEIVKHTSIIEQSTWMAAIGQKYAAFPIGVDIDTGYGNEPFSVVLTCRQAHLAGAQYVQIEDQHSINKSCGHMAGGHGTGKEIISKEEMINLRIAPAVSYANMVTDFTVMARTDAIAVEGIDSALERMHAYKDAGAKLLFVEAPVGEEQLRIVAEEFKNADAVNVANMIETSPHTPYKTPRELHENGFGIGLYCIGGIMVGRIAQQNYYKAIAIGNNVLEESGDRNNWFDGFNRIIGRNFCESYNSFYRNKVIKLLQNRI